MRLRELTVKNAPVIVTPWGDIPPDKYTLLTVAIAQGLTTKAAAKRSGVPLEAVEAVCQEPEFQEFVKGLQRRVRTRVHALVQGLASKALRKLGILMDTADLDSQKVKCAEIIMNSYMKIEENEILKLKLEVSALHAKVGQNAAAAVVRDAEFDTSGISPEQIGALVAAGGRILDMDLSQVPMEKLKAIAGETQSAIAQSAKESQETEDGLHAEAGEEPEDAGLLGDDASEDSEADLAADADPSAPDGAGTL